MFKNIILLISELERLNINMIICDEKSILDDINGTIKGITNNIHFMNKMLDKYYGYKE